MNDAGGFRFAGDHVKLGPGLPGSPSPTPGGAGKRRRIERRTALFEPGTQVPWGESAKQRKGALFPPEPVS